MKQLYKNLVLVLISGLLLTACQPNGKIRSIFSGKATANNKSEFSGHSEIVMLLGYFRFLDSLSSDTLEVERERTKKTLAKFHDPIHRLRLAMLLSLSLSNSQDYDLALKLLTENLESPVPVDPTLRDFSLFLSASIRQFKKKDEVYQGLEKKMLQNLEREKLQGETLIRKLKKLEDRVKLLSGELKSENAQREKLQKMIDGLKIIEKNIIIGEDSGSPGSQ